MRRLWACCLYGSALGQGVPPLEKVGSKLVICTPADVQTKSFCELFPKKFKRDQKVFPCRPVGRHTESFGEAFSKSFSGVKKQALVHFIGSKPTRKVWGVALCEKALQASFKLNRCIYKHLHPQIITCKLLIILHLSTK
jgi:hypothetical protein